MKTNTTYIAYLLLILLIAMISEKAIPHSHLEKNGTIIAISESQQQSTPSHEKENEERLHSSYYPTTLPLYSFRSTITNSYAYTIHNPLTINPFPPNKYNTSPPIRYTQLYATHIYAANSPPVYS